MKKILIVLFLSYLILTTTTLYAEKVFPVFSGRWVYSGSDLDSDCHSKVTNNCGTSYSYGCDDSKNKIISKVLKLLAKRFPQCTNIRLDPPGIPGDPEHFSLDPAGPLTHDDWVTMLRANPNITQTEDRMWVDPNVYPCLGLVTIRPVYSCPSGSVISYDEKGQAYCNKTANTKACVADVVGRDYQGIPLPVPGHVGFVGPNNTVIQVLNDKEVIHTDSKLTEFQHITKYWGERYGLEFDDNTKMMELGVDDAAKVVTAGVEQKQFDPEYTFGRFWQAGGYENILVYDSSNSSWIKQNAFKRAKFRCDTFVNYCYNQGLGLSGNKRLPRSIVTAPISTYQSFLGERANIIINNLTSKNLTTELKQEMNDKNYALIDVNMQKYLRDTKITRQTKVAFLMKQLNESKNDSNYGYLLDNLAGLKAIEVAPQLIANYQSETNGMKKSKIISAITESVSAKLEKSVNVQYVTQAQKFITDVLKNENNADALHQTIAQSLSILPMNQENYYLIASAMNRLEQSDKSEMTPKLKYTFLLSMAFANEKMQSWLLPKILLSTMSTADKIILKEELKFMINQLRPEDINEKVKEKVKLFIQ